MKWSIIIPTWRRADLLCQTLDALRSQSSKSFEVIVVCDGVDEETSSLSLAYQAPFPLRWIFHSENCGPAASRNSGAFNAAGEFLLFLDDDVTAEPELLRAHEEALSGADAWPPVAVLGRIVEQRTAPFRSNTDAYLQRAWERHLSLVQPETGLLDTQSVGDLADQSACFGVNCSIGRSLFLKLAGFDPRLRIDEDSELGFRMYREGIQFRFAHKAVVYHRGTRDLSKYYPHCWRTRGRQDFHRVRDSGELGAQTARLAGMRYGNPVFREFRKSIFSNPEAYLKLASFLQKVTDITGNSRTFALWARLCEVAEYWNSVKATGVSIEELLAMFAAPCRIVMLHSISTPRSPEENEYYISPHNFRLFIEYVRQSGYQYVSPGDWLRGNIPERSLLMTLDDGYDDLYTELLPMLERYRLHPLVFLVAGQIGGTNIFDSVLGVRSRNLLTASQIREMQQHGIVFGAHSMTHPELTSLSNDALRREVTESKRRLEDLLGEEVDWFAYPYGVVDRRVRAAVLEAGYKAAVTVEPGLSQWQDPLALNRIEIKDYDSILQISTKLRTGRGIRPYLGRIARALGIRNRFRVTADQSAETSA